MACQAVLMFFALCIVSHLVLCSACMVNEPSILQWKVGNVDVEEGTCD
jgi:hypothetical protein